MHISCYKHFLTLNPDTDSTNVFNTNLFKELDQAELVLQFKVNQTRLRTQLISPKPKT